MLYPLRVQAKTLAKQIPKISVQEKLPLKLLMKYNSCSSGHCCLSNSLRNLDQIPFCVNKGLLRSFRLCCAEISLANWLNKLYRTFVERVNIFSFLPKKAFTAKEGDHTVLN